MDRRSDLRNVAIIAHVDHGKTTLVDGLLDLAGAFQRGERDRERAMDSGDLERERGITITSKPTSLDYKGTRINLVDTPGHADFGGEVERVLNMVDAAVLLVDAFEGPMPQTRFVTEKAVKMGLKIILAVNKVDRDGARPHKAVDDTFDLLANLGADEDQLEFPTVFCSARERYAMDDPEGERQDLSLVLDTIIEHAPGPVANPDGPLSMWVSTLAHDSFVGFVAIGRIQSGKVAKGERIALVRPGATEDAAPEVEEFRVRTLVGFAGLQRFERDAVEAGDIVGITGMSSLKVGDTITTADVESRIVHPPLKVEPPTLSMRFRVNDGPFAGQEGKFVTSRKVGERLQREILSNVALEVADTETAEEFEVRGRGELHLSVLIETMRREGYEFCVSRPRIIIRETDDGSIEEPFERAMVRCESDYSGSVIEKLGRRMGELVGMEEDGPGRSRMEFMIPTRGLIGYRSELLTDTRGTGTISSVFDHYGPHQGSLKMRPHGVQIVLEPGETVTYSLHRLQERGELFIGPGNKVYAGMILGTHVRDTDIIVNPCTTKKLTNIRSAGADEKLFLTPATVLSLEEAITFIEDDELVEVTPESIRLRKRELDHNARKRTEKRAAG